MRQRKALTDEQKARKRERDFIWRMKNHERVTENQRLNRQRKRAAFAKLAINEFFYRSGGEDQPEPTPKGWPSGYQAHQMRSGLWRFSFNGVRHQLSFDSVDLARKAAWTEHRHRSAGL